MRSVSNARSVIQMAVTLSLFLHLSEIWATGFILETSGPYPNEDGLCALVEAIDNANSDDQVHADCPAGNGADEVTLGTTITLDGSVLFPASDPVFFDSGSSGLPEISSEITLRQGAITRAEGLDFRFLVVQPTGSLKLEDASLINGKAVGSCSFSSGDSFTGCGGGVLVRQGALTLERAYFSNNNAIESTATDYPRGGAIMLFGASLAASEASFNGNKAEYGGAIGAQAATAVIQNSRFDGNTASSSGGAIYSSFTSDIVISSSTFSDNHVTAAPTTGNGGGAIDNAGSRSQLKVIGSHFSANSAARGGAINNFNASDADVINCTFNENNATNGGGAIRNEGSGAVLNLISSTITKNSSLQGAGLVNGNGSSDTANIFDSHFIGNEASSDGGGIASRGILNINNSLIDHNSGNDGGGISIGSATNQAVTIEASTVRNNFASFNGGGLHFEKNPNTFPNSLTIRKSTFDNNKADEGGGLYAEVVDVSISGSTFSNNTASQVGFGGGGGIHVRSFVVTGAEVEITNSTVSGNSASQDGGGIYLNGSALDALITSTTIADNLADSTNGADGLHSLVTPARVKVKDLILDNNGNRNCLKTASIGYTDGGNNISSDDSCEFADAGSGTGDSVDPLLNVLDNNGGSVSTHALQPGSPAIDAGSGDCPDSDQRGAARNGGCDIGSFEAGVVVPVLSLSVDTDTLIESDETAATLSVTLDNSATNSQPVRLAVPLRVTGSATGLGFDYKLSNQNDLEADPAGLVAPFVFDLAAGERSTLTATITAIDDLLFEDVEVIEIEVGLNGFAAFAKGNTVRLKIISDDPNPLPDRIFNDGFEVWAPNSETLP